jgi:hypothetical protein
VHSSHMVTEIPVAWKAISCHATFAALICTQVGFVAMPVHSMSFTLVTKEAGRGREPGGLASNDFASIGFQVGVHEFAEGEGVVSVLKVDGRGREGSYS